MAEIQSFEDLMWALPRSTLEFHLEILEIALNDTLYILLLHFLPVFFSILFETFMTCVDGRHT